MLRPMFILKFYASNGTAPSKIRHCVTHVGAYLLQ